MKLTPHYIRVAIDIKNALSRNEWREDGYCKHGKYVGGCGVDLMCHDCEMGYSDYEVALGQAHEQMRRDRAGFAAKLETLCTEAEECGSSPSDFLTSEEWMVFWSARFFLAGRIDMKKNPTLFDTVTGFVSSYRENTKEA